MAKSTQGKAKAALKRGRPSDPFAGYRKVAAGLREDLDAGRLPRGAVVPSLKKLAGRFGVSEITVRRALEVLAREGRIGKGAGRRLLVQEPKGLLTATHRLAVLVVSGYLDFNLRTRYGQQIQAGLDLGVTDQVRSFLLVHHWKFFSQVPANLDLLPVTGLLLWGQYDPEVMRAYERMDCPVVLVDRPRADWKMHAACVDNEAAAYEATRRLIDLGHRRIAFLRQVLLRAKEVDPDTVERQRGYARALKEHGLPFDSGLVVNCTASDTAESPAVTGLFEDRKRPTAVLAVDAGKARLVLEAARARGMGVPGKLSVAGFQEKDGGLAELSGPRIDFTQVGLAAAALLKEPKQPLRERRVAATWFEGTTISSVK